MIQSCSDTHQTTLVGVFYCHTNYIFNIKYMMQQSQSLSSPQQPLQVERNCAPPIIQHHCPDFGFGHRYCTIVSKNLEPLLEEGRIITAQELECVRLSQVTSVSDSLSISPSTSQTVKEYFSQSVSSSVPQSDGKSVVAPVPQSVGTSFSSYMSQSFYFTSVSQSINQLVSQSVNQ